MTAERTNIADIVCIGSQKASTSWLHSILNSHPDTWAFPDSEPVTSTCKEAHFWDWNHHRGVDWYRELMTPPRPGLLTMDFTPEYATLAPEAIAECKALNPGARIIYILRDPLARAVSAMRMHLLWRFGPQYDTPVALGDLFYGLIKEAKLDLHGSYVRNWSNWKRHYHDILVLNYEDFHSDRIGSVTRVMNFCGLDPARIGPQEQKRIDRLMERRVWESTPFVFEPAALSFLHGFTWRTREATEKTFDMHFKEADTLLKG